MILVSVAVNDNIESGINELKNDLIQAASEDQTGDVREDDINEVHIIAFVIVLVYRLIYSYLLGLPTNIG
jgi:hypothetical protein